MKEMLKIFCLALGLFLNGMLVCSRTIAAQEFILDEETKAICNTVMENIYHDILGAKKDYPELSQFDEKAMFKNALGIYAIVYEYKPTGQDKKDVVFSLGVTLVDIKNPIFEEYGLHAFNLQFPILGLKFAGYYQWKNPRKYYDLFEMINRHGLLLADHQQKYMPLQLNLKTQKPISRVQELISFEVELKNVSKKNMWVKELNEETLYCLFDNKFWGTQAAEYRSARQFILKAGEAFTRKFLGEKFHEPREVEIYCSYGLSVQGVKPSGVLKVKIGSE